MHGGDSFIISLYITLILLFHRMATRVPKVEIILEGDDSGRTAQTATTASTTSVSSNKDQAASNVRYGMSGMRQ